MHIDIKASRTRVWWLAAALTACSPSDAPSRAAPAPAQPQPEPPPESQDEDGERRARDAGAGLVGQPAPALTVTTLDGASIDLGALLGKRPIYLKFWATWCVPCRAQMPGFAKIFADMGDRLTVLAVDTGFADSEPEVRAYRKEMDLRMPIVIDDGRLAAAFNLRVTPQHVVIDRSGRIAFIGHRDDSSLHDALRAALADADGPVVPTTPTAAPTFAPGDVVAGLSVTTTTGDAVPLGASEDGKPTAVMLFAPWCESYLADSRPATASACRRVREAAEQLATTGDAHWLGVSGGLWAAEADMTDFIKTTGTRLPLALDASGAVMRAFGVRDIPAVAVLAGDGRLVRLLGPEDTDIEAALTAAKRPATNN